jgi:hypothetical protein
MFLNPVDLRGSPGSILHHIKKGLEKMDFAIFASIGLFERDPRGVDCNRRGNH